MGESLTQQRRVEEEGLRVVNSCSGRRNGRGWRIPCPDGIPGESSG